MVYLLGINRLMVLVAATTGVVKVVPLSDEVLNLISLSLRRSWPQVKWTSR